MSSQSSTYDLKDELKAEAYRLGFLLSGFTLPDPPAHYSTFLDWLAQHRQAGMAYLDTERARQLRADPRLILPETRSIFVLGIPYDSPTLIDGEISSTFGRVAAYAWGTDYHEIIPPRLEMLVKFTEGLVGREIQWKGYTDTGPVLERDLAMQAGLGWIGKNTCLISPRAGSYFLLAEIFWDVELPPDPPTGHDFCGSCRRCIEACPTGCILPDRTLDAGRCISYLTIENKGAIAPDLRPLMDGWVFGCDVCQQVCPWNIRFTSKQGDPVFAPQPETSQPDLINDLSLSPEAFNRRFKLSPIRRSRRRGYLRNVAVILGNRHDPDAVPALEKTLRSEPEVLVRAHAAWALGQIGGPDARLALETAQTTEKIPEVLAEIREALNNFSR